MVKVRSAMVATLAVASSVSVCGAPGGGGATGAAVALQAAAPPPPCSRSGNSSSGCGEFTPFSVTTERNCGYTGVGLYERFGPLGFTVKGEEGVCSNSRFDFSFVTKTNNPLGDIKSVECDFVALVPERIKVENSGGRALKEKTVRAIQVSGSGLRKIIQLEMVFLPFQIIRAPDGACARNNGGFIFNINGAKPANSSGLSIENGPIKFLNVWYNQSGTSVQVSTSTSKKEISFEGFPLGEHLFIQDSQDGCLNVIAQSSQALCKSDENIDGKGGGSGGFVDSGTGSGQGSAQGSGGGSGSSGGGNIMNPNPKSGGAIPEDVDSGATDIVGISIGAAVGGLFVLGGFVIFRLCDRPLSWLARRRTSSTQMSSRPPHLDSGPPRNQGDSA